MEATILTNVILPLCLFIIMLGMGLSLTLDDFRRIFKSPKPILIGLFNQLIILPLIAFGIAHLFGLSNLMAIGLMILAACPGGVTSNLISHVSRGDTALSVSMTAISSFISMITIPLYIGFAFKHFSNTGQAVDINEMEMLIQVIAIVIVPISLGMFIRSRSDSFAARMDKPVRIFSIVLLAFLLISIILNERERIVEHFPSIGAATILLNLLTLAIGYYSAKLLSLNRKEAITIAIESGIQNGTLAIVIALTVLNNSALSIPAGMYSMLMFVSAGFIMWWFGRKVKSE